MPDKRVAYIRFAAFAVLTWPAGAFTVPFPLRLLALGSAAIIIFAAGLSACGGGGSSTTPTAQTSDTAHPAVSAALTLNLNALDNYAAPALPVHYDAAVLAADNTPRRNPVSDRVATLGRVLFHDKRLSLNDAVSCASCHQPASGFSDPARFSTGFSGTAFGSAHAMRLGNLRFYRPGTMFWDKRADSVESQASRPIQDPVEMGFDAAHGGMAALLTKLQAVAYYSELFTFAFGDPAITETRIQDALAQFERSMVSAGSRWDTGFAQVFDPAVPDQGRNRPVPGLTAEEDRGRALFMGGPGVGVGCAGCHAPPTFALTPNSLSNGLDAGETRIFKSPSLKNVAVGGPFMHDGRFATLEEVVQHYDSGVQPGPAVDPRLLTPAGVPRRLNLSPADRAALVAFMKTLTDTAFLADPRFSSPFRR
jgi:cytochrome c peroxidase